MEGLVYSPKEKLPLFKLTCDSNGVRTAEYLNSRTKCTEKIKVSRLVICLLEVEMSGKGSGGMVFSPKRRIPLGIVGREPCGAYYIEVKYKHNKERILFSTYVSLLLESEALKAG